MNEKIIAQDSEDIIVRTIMNVGSLGCAPQYLVSGSLGIPGVGLIKELKLSTQILIAAGQLYGPAYTTFNYFYFQCVIRNRGGM